MNKKGFTLIELLAVIVILAIIALIATPIVLNIIKDSKENAQLRSAEFYLDAVEYSIANSILHNNPMIDGIYDVLENGNLCLEYDENKTCLNERVIDVKGEKPKRGYVIIDKGNLVESRLTYEENSVLTLDGKSPFISKYEIGDEVSFNPGDKDRIWNVISETQDTVTLMLNENIKDEQGNNINWISLEDYNKYNELDDKQKECTGDDCIDSDEGPVTAFISLNQLTNNWNNVDAIKDYTYINSDIENSLTYKSIGIKDGITKITDSKGNENTLLDESNNPISTKARLLTIEEIQKITYILMPKFREVNLLRIYQKELDKQNIKDFTAKEFIENYAKEQGIQYEIMIFMISIDVFDFTFLEFLFQNLYNNAIDNGYFLLSSLDYEADNIVVTHYDKKLYLDTYPDSKRTSIRPVIEISKDKLK